MAEGRLGIIDGQKRLGFTEGIWHFDDDDWALIAMLQDPIYCAELLFQDPNNKTYGGCYHVMDYQYPLFRSSGNKELHPCSRSVGKTESLKADSVSHAFRRQGEDLLLTAPELIHLLPLCDAIEARIVDTRLTREFLDTRNQRTGITHKPFQVDFLDGTKIIGRIPKLSGPQPLDAMLLTPFGWTTMGEVEVGDVVVGADGLETDVLEIHETGRKRIYELKFSDGSVARASGDHRWLVGPSNDGGMAARWRVRLTSEIRNDLETKVNKQAGARRNRWMIPATPMVEFEREGELPIDPYLLGVLLGDGGISQRTVTLTLADDELVEAVEEALPTECSLVKRPERPYSYYIRTGSVGKRQKAPLRAALETLGLAGAKAATKHIPEVYLFAGAADRLALLQGLMDTDGTVGTNGRTWFGSKSEQLARDVAHLARSLGCWASVRSQEHQPYTQMLNGAPYQNKGGTHWRTAISCNHIEVVRLYRKRARLKSRKECHRQIVSVTPIGYAETRCISVRSSAESYLTDDFVVTLNTGVKGQHSPDLRVDESQDYPKKGWTEVFPTVKTDHTDHTGKPDYTIRCFGVHSGARDTEFYTMSTKGDFRVHTVTAIMRPGWGPEEKAMWTAVYGGTQSPDYRRNILGEAGGASSAYFVTARLVQCMDQDRESRYNTVEFKRQRFMAEELDSMLGEQEQDRATRNAAMYELLGSLLDLPDLKGQQIYAGEDIGLVNDPTVVTLWSIEPDSHKRSRMKLVRMFHLWRFREEMIRMVAYHIGWKYGARLRGFGHDVTGLGLPLFQAMEADEVAPQSLLDVSRGYVFSAKVAIGVDKSMVSKDTQGNLRDAYGNMVEEERDPFTQVVRYVVKMSMIEASTRYLREWVDSGWMMLPFDPEIISDMQGETETRVKAMAGLKKKPNAFHILDSMRTVAMVYKAADVEAQLAVAEHTPVLARAVDMGAAEVTM